ncbi:MAG: Asp-tRNA(Asn)/Glu-tRNA(Gln) amidotransferase subunit GatC [Balneolaceae bacterium]|nr:Asp-tRNA(Asn)/Glu-tRNA(Gln) amidotransferase subunit GatC [Balneolaceae bacterium]
MSVTKEDVHYVANLARLQLSDKEAESLKKDMNKILGYIDTLNEVDTTGVEPLEHVTEVTASSFRKDDAREPVSHEDALKNAPDADSDYFRVPRVIE